MDKKTYGIVGYEADCEKYPRKFTKSTDKRPTHAVVTVVRETGNLVMLVGMCGSSELARKLQSKSKKSDGSTGYFETRICETYEIK